MSALARVVPIAVGAMLVAGAHAWGRWLQNRGYRLWLNDPPLLSQFDPRLPEGGLGVLALAASFALAGAAVLAAPRLAARLPWRSLLLLAFAVTVCWAASLALFDGTEGLLRSPTSPNDYLHDLPLVGSAVPFLQDFVERIGGYATHVRAHPPGMILLLWAMDGIGLSGPWWLVAIELAGGAAAGVAALVALRELAGEGVARAAAPFVAVAPAAITIGSSGDAFFAGVGGWAVALIVLATGRDGGRADALAIAGGFLFGATMFLSYGLVLLSVILLTVAVGRRRVRAVLVAAIVSALVVAAFVVGGFWWVEGLLATRLQYLAGAARDRPYFYFVVANLAAFAIVIGPAAWIGLARLRDRRAWMLVGGALIAVALADVSGMSKAEVERIWLPFVPWVLLASAAVPHEMRRGALLLSVGTGLALQLALTRPW